MTLEGSAENWPTPDANVWAGSNRSPSPGAATRPALELTARTWATPQGRDYKGSGLEHSKGGRDLTQDTEKWATPQALDWKSGDLPNRVGSPDLSLQAQETVMPGPEFLKSIPPSRRRLNPEFVTWLMGLPRGWTDFAPLETASFLQWQLEHSELLRRG